MTGIFLICHDKTMSTSKKPKNKRTSKNNPTDPNLLARDVMEAFLGEPLTRKVKPKPARNQAKAKKK